MVAGTVMPDLREIIADLRGTDRALRVSAHPDLDLVVLSIWREDHCVASVQIAASEISALVNVLVAGLAEMDSVSPAIATEIVA
jgi:hypothetical protein